MNIRFYIRGLDLRADSRRGLQDSLERLQGLVAVSDAAIVLEHQREAAPAFRAYVSLAVPGPDIHAEAHDHTLQAAWLKVTNRLRKQIEQRKSRQQTRAHAAARGRNGPKTKRGFHHISCGRFSPVCGA